MIQRIESGVWMTFKALPDKPKNPSIVWAGVHVPQFQYDARADLLKDDSVTFHAIG